MFNAFTIEQSSILKVYDVYMSTIKNTQVFNIFRTEKFDGLLGKAR